MADLETQLKGSFMEVLKSCGYILELLNSNKKRSNLLLAANTSLNTPAVAARLSSSIATFDDILDDTASKIEDAKWTVQQIVARKRKEEELKEQEQEKRLKEKLEEDAREAKIKSEKELRNSAITANGSLRADSQKADISDAKKPIEVKDNTPVPAQLTPNFGFESLPTEFNDLPGGELTGPSDILASYDLDGKGASLSIDEEMQNLEGNNGDVDMNNLLGNDELLLQGLNMSLFEAENNGDLQVDEEFDVGNFLNQLGDDD